MTTGEIINKFGVEHLGRFYSIYRGLVVNDLDDTGRGRLQISIPSIQNGITVWANPRNYNGGPGFGFKTLTPKPGSVVHIEFEGGDPLRALWSYHGWARFEVPEELDGDTMGVITPNGNKILLKEKNGALFIEMEGDINIKTKNGIVLSEGKEIHLQNGDVGIPQTTDVVSRLNALERKLNLYINAMKKAPPILSSDKGASFKAFMVSQVGSDLPLTKNSDIESETIKQPR